MLEKILKALGLDTAEIKIYMVLLESGEMTAGDLAKRIGMPRTNTYRILDSIKAKNVVGQTMRQGVRSFYAESPDVLDRIFRHKKQELEDQYDAFSQIMPFLKKKMAGAYVRPEFEVYHGRQGYERAINTILFYRDIETYLIWPMSSMMGVLDKQYMWRMNKQRIENNVKVQSLWLRSKALSFKKHPYTAPGTRMLREMRVASAELNFSMCAWVVANKVIFLSSQKEAFGFVVESAELAGMMKGIHQFIWSDSKPVYAEETDLKAFYDYLDGKGQIL